MILQVISYACDAVHISALKTVIQTSLTNSEDQMGSIYQLIAYLDFFLH